MISPEKKSALSDKINFAPLVELVSSREDWLMGRILSYAKQQGYARYTSTLEEAWRVSIKGFSDPLIAALEDGATSLELLPEDDFSSDPISAFGVVQAQRHRSRGITLGLFLGLMKYYRQCYVDLLDVGHFQPTDQQGYRVFIDRFFDRVELGFCVEWSGNSESDKLAELQSANRLQTNEKNRYLTIFESLNDPVFFVDETNSISNVNHAAAKVFAGIHPCRLAPRQTYRNDLKRGGAGGCRPARG